MPALTARAIATDFPAAVDAVAFETVGAAGAEPFPEGPLWTQQLTIRPRKSATVPFLDLSTCAVFGAKRSHFAADKPDVPQETVAEKVEARLVRDLAVRVRFTWTMYVAFCILFVQTQYGNRWRGGILAFALAILAVGVVRLWIGDRLATVPDAQTEAKSLPLLALTASHSIVWGAFVSFSLWAAYGEAPVELCVVVGVAGFATGGAAVLCGRPRLAILHIVVQCGPVMAWALAARDRFGLLIFALVLAFVVFLVATILANHRHLVVLFRTQVLLEAQGEELRSAKETAERAKEVAEEASSARARFLANMSHEIRTPLHGVLGLAQVLSETPLDESQRDLLSSMSRSGNHLLAIVNDVLDCSKIASGRLTLESVEVDLAGLLRDIIAPVEVMARAKGLRCVYELAPELSDVYRADPVRLRQVLSNLLANAVKFTEAGEVRLEVTAERPGWVRYSVVDTGIGISEAQLDELFKDFCQADASTTRRFGGTGLGLAIARRLVEAMGGTLSVSSQPGLGSRFTVVIPLAKAGEPDPACIAEASTADDTVLPRDLRILIAEDNAVNRMIVERFLAGRGVTVETAETGRAALERHSARPYDVILMDCHMPEMDGLEATAAIRGLNHAADVPIIGVTASAFDEDRERCLRAGMNGYLAKPLRRQDLLQAVAGAVRSRSGYTLAGDPVRAMERSLSSNSKVDVRGL